MKKYRVLCDIKVVDEDGEVVDHRGFTPRAKDGTPQICQALVGGTDDIRVANGMMNNMFSAVLSINAIRDAA